MNFRHLEWSPTEKKLARKAFDAALEQLVLAKAMAEFKSRASAATTPSDMWDVEQLFAPAAEGH